MRRRRGARACDVLTARSHYQREEDGEAPDDAALEDDGTEDLTEGGRDIVDD
jgi:hypothetical protein